MKESHFGSAPGRAITRAAAMLLALAPVAATAHSFTTLILGPEGDPAALQATVEGFRLATRERDGHPNETSDGHLGGIDVQIVAREAAAGRVGEVAGADFVLMTGGEMAVPTAAEVSSRAVVLRPGRLPPEEIWTGTAASGGADFAGRFRTAYGREPGRAAAEGYNAARRIDAAVRPLRAVSDRAALADALAATKTGLAWE